MKFLRKENIKRYIPIIDTLSNYKAKYIPLDLIAAITLVAITIPEAVAYAQMAGVPPEVGFYTIPLALFAYAIFGSSRNVIVGPSSTIAVMSAAVIGTLAIQGTDDFLALTAALAIICGLIFLIFGIAKLGFISNFISGTVITGFIFGLALFIIIGQIPKVLGISGTDGNFFEKGVYIVKNLGSIQWWTFLIGGLSIIILFLLSKYVPRIPGAIVIVIISILMVTFLNLEAKGVHIVGEIPSALPKFSIPNISFNDILRLIPGALGIVFIGYAETLSASRNYGVKYHYEVSPNQELIALGVANLGSGFSSGFAVDASLSRSAANDSAGAKSQLSPIIATGLIIMVVIWLTPLFYNLAEAAIGAIIIHAVWHLMKVRELKRFYNIKRVDFWLSLVALFGVLIFGVLPGLVIAVVASMLAITLSSSKLNMVQLGKAPDSEVYTDIKRHPENKKISRMVILRPDSPIFYANIKQLQVEIRNIIKSSKEEIKAVIIDLEVTNDLDIQSIDTLNEIKEELEYRGIELILARVHGRIQDLMNRSVLKDMIDEKRVFKSVSDAVSEFTKMNNKNV
jgi:high affinity sulfate transporter 1